MKSSAFKWAQTITLQSRFPSAFCWSGFRALLRREQLRKQPVAEDPANVFVRGDLVLDSTRHVCTWKGKPVDLTVTEFFAR